MKLPRFLNLMAGIAASAGVTPAAAQVLEIGNGGSVTTQVGPTVTTSAGATAISAAVPAAPGQATFHPATPFLPGAFFAAPERARTRMVPAGDLAALFQSVASESGVDARLLHAVAWQESRFRHARVSPKGAIGIMQLMPGTARDIGVDPHDLLQNLRGGARLLARLLHQYNGNIDLTLAAYNAGPEAVRRWGGIPPYAETRDYVRRIKSALFL